MDCLRLIFKWSILFIFHEFLLFESRIFNTMRNNTKKRREIKVYLHIGTNLLFYKRNPIRYQIIFINACKSAAPQINLECVCVCVSRFENSSFYQLFRSSESSIFYNMLTKMCGSLRFCKIGK